MISEVRNQIKGILQDAIDAAVQSGDLPHVNTPDIPFSPTKAPEHGDIASPIALSLAKIANTSPRKIAETIANHIQLGTSSLIRKVEVAGPGFINIYLSSHWLYDVLRTIKDEGTKFGHSDHGEGSRVQVEFVSANPTGPINIVSGRAAAVGDSLVNLLSAVGYKAIREYYVNDAGGQVENLGASIDVRYRELLGESGLEIPDGGYHGTYLIDLAQSIIDESDDKYLQFDDAERVATFRNLGVEHLLAAQKTTLERFGVHFDIWSSEQALRESGKPDEIIEVFRQRGYLYEADGATWFRMTDFGDAKDCVVIKSDGEYTYFVPDAAYHRDKFERGFDKAIDILGPDHQGHVEHLKHFVEALGLGNDWLEVRIIQQVNLIDSEGNRIEMSKRSGQFYTLDALIDELAEAVDDRFAVDVARYFFLMRSNTSHLDFDLQLAVTQANENPVFYVQYAHARCCSIFREMENQGIDQAEIDEVLAEYIDEPESLQLIRHLAEYPEVVLHSAEKREPHRMTHYLYELAALFHGFYNEHRVLDPSNPDLTQARLMLVGGVQTVLRNGLALLGISAPKSM